MLFVVQAHTKAQSGWEMLQGSYLLGCIEGNYRGDVGNYQWHGNGIEVDRTGVNACSIRAKMVGKIQTEQCSKSKATIVQECEYIGKWGRSGHPPHYVAWMTVCSSAVTT